MVEFDLATLVVFGTMAGIIGTFYFNLAKQRSERKKEHEEEAERVALEKERFAKSVDDAIDNGVRRVSEKIDDKLGGFEKRFDDYKTVNRDDIQDIKQRLNHLYEELGKLDMNKESKAESENKIQKIRNEIELLQRRIGEIEVKISRGAEVR